MALRNTVSTVRVTASEEVRDLVVDAARAFAPWKRTPPRERARVLDGIARAIDAAAETLIPVALRETRLPEWRLRDELERTTFQIRLFAEALRDGGFLDARIDHADPQWPAGAPRPDLRRMKEPLGPVAVFAASNFPFAFSVAGGDTASALAAGNPVIVKSHPGHPGLSLATAEVVAAAIEEAGADPGILSLVHGTEAGRLIVTAREVKAAGFTGSIPGGRALFDLAQRRPDPIPFYGELGSNNPVFVTPAAAERRAEEIAEGFVESVTGRMGQISTKPGTLIVPRGSRIVELLEEAELPEAAPMLNDRLHGEYERTLAQFSARHGVEPLRGGRSGAVRPGADPSPAILITQADYLRANAKQLQEECFGPASLVVTYREGEDLAELAGLYEGQLTATVHAEPECDVEALLEVLAEKAGRVLWNQWPTGVSVTYAQQHGGPYPASTAPGSTSVGTAAIERFLRPVAYQGFPQERLPEPLRDDNPWGCPRLVDGKPEGA